MRSGKGIMAGNIFNVGHPPWESFPKSWGIRKRNGAVSPVNYGRVLKNGKGMTSMEAAMAAMPTLHFKPFVESEDVDDTD
jgi:hypothetical protein